MRSKFDRCRRLRLEPLEPRLMLAATLTNGMGDGLLTVRVDGYGAFGSSVGADISNADFDPVGILDKGSTTFQSGVLIRSPQLRSPQFLTSGSIDNNGNLPEPLINGTSTRVVSTFVYESLNFVLTQELLPLLASNGVQIGSQVVQTYLITNGGNGPIRFELLRYFDGDLEFAGSGFTDDIGGRTFLEGREVLFENDTVAGQVERSTFVGISADGGLPISSGRFQIAAYSDLLTQILADNPDPLRNTIQGDTDGNGVTDDTYDITLALRNEFELAAGGQATYTTVTIFGTGFVAPEVPPPPPERPRPEPPPRLPDGPPRVPPPSLPPLLLLDRVPQAQPLTITPGYGTNGYTLPGNWEVATAGGALAIDAALANDEIDQAFLLAGFLDFIDPEMLVVDLGDEPPAQLADGSSKTLPANDAEKGSAQAEVVAHRGSDAIGKAGNGPAHSVTYLKPPLSAADRPDTDGIAVALKDLAVANWKWFASTTAVLLLTGAAWKGRYMWIEAARKLRSR